MHGESLLSTWLHRIVVNSSLMQLRREKRRAEDSIVDLDTWKTAQALGLTATAVKVRRHRARQALKTLLEREAGAETFGIAAAMEEIAECVSA